LSNLARIAPFQESAANGRLDLGLEGRLNALARAAKSQMPRGGDDRLLDYSTEAKHGVADSQPRAIDVADVVATDVRLRLAAQTSQAGLQMQFAEALFLETGFAVCSCPIFDARPGLNVRGTRPRRFWKAAHHRSRSASVANLPMIRPRLLVSIQRPPSLYFLPTATSTSDAGTVTLAIVMAVPFEPTRLAFTTRRLDVVCFRPVPAKPDGRRRESEPTVKAAG
jgi:hypothetical protein